MNQKKGKCKKNEPKKRGNVKKMNQKKGEIVCYLLKKTEVNKQGIEPSNHRSGAVHFWNMNNVNMNMMNYTYINIMKNYMIWIWENVGYQSFFTKKKL